MEHDLEKEVARFRDSNNLFARMSELQVENARLQSENRTLRSREIEVHKHYFFGGVEVFTEFEFDSKRLDRLLSELAKIPQVVDLMHTDAKAYYDLNIAIQEGDWETLEALALRGYYKPTQCVLKYPGAERLAKFVD